MNLQETLSELFWNPTTVESLPGFIVSLVVALVLGAVLGQAYVWFGTSLSNRRLFARNFLLLTASTTLVISIVKSSLALSLGLVGALSIVRFRAAIKEPEELAYLFLAIAVGLGLGAGHGLVTVVALVLILGLLALRSFRRREAGPANLFLTVSSPAPGTLTTGQIVDALTSVGARARLKRVDEGPEMLRVSFRVSFGASERIEEFSRRLRGLEPAVEITCLEDAGLNH